MTLKIGDTPYTYFVSVPLQESLPYMECISINILTLTYYVDNTWY